MLVKYDDMSYASRIHVHRIFTCVLVIMFSNLNFCPHAGPIAPTSNSASPSTFSSKQAPAGGQAASTQLPPSSDHPGVTDKDAAHAAHAAAKKMQTARKPLPTAQPLNKVLSQKELQAVCGALQQRLSAQKPVRLHGCTGGLQAHVLMSSLLCSLRAL